MRELLVELDSKTMYLDCLWVFVELLPVERRRFFDEVCCTYLYKDNYLECIGDYAG